LFWTVDAPPQAEVHYSHIVNIDWLDGNSPRLTAISDLGIGTVPPPVQSPARGRYVIAPHWRHHHHLLQAA
jgi:hypothetical protein